MTGSPGPHPIVTEAAGPSVPVSVRRILPAHVAVAEAFGELPDAQLFPAETACVSRAVDRRRREFAAGRTLARRALRQLGAADAAIPRGVDREPVWPSSFTGSITHCPGYCAAAVAPAATALAIGIDAELAAPLPPGVLSLVARAEERAWIEERAAGDLPWDRLLFSAKESVFKSWFPLARRWLAFTAVRVTFDETRAAFRASFVDDRLDAAGRTWSILDGRYLVGQGLVLTAITIEAVRQ